VTDSGNGAAAPTMRIRFSRIRDALLCFPFLSTAYKT
jgi:hypothetical protein